eukprot:354739-Chlamydomonas_euryale.AAC.2
MSLGISPADGCRGRAVRRPPAVAVAARRRCARPPAQPSLPGGQVPHQPDVHAGLGVFRERVDSSTEAQACSSLERRAGSSAKVHEGSGIMENHACSGSTEEHACMQHEEACRQQCGGACWQ